MYIILNQCLFVNLWLNSFVNKKFMGKTTGFIEYSRSLPILQKPQARIGNWDEFHADLPESELKKQGARCMNCGIPFCHTGATFDRCDRRLSAWKFDSRMERSGLSRQMVRGLQKSRG